MGSVKYYSDNYLDYYLWWNILVVRRIVMESIEERADRAIQAEGRTEPLIANLKLVQRYTEELIKKLKSMKG